MRHIPVRPDKAGETRKPSAGKLKGQYSPELDDDDRVFLACSRAVCCLRFSLKYTSDDLRNCGFAPGDGRLACSDLYTDKTTQKAVEQAGAGRGKR